MTADPTLLKYLASLMPDVQTKIECAGCGLEVPIASAAVRGDEMFCTDVCGERERACMVKPQPKGLRLEGIDV